MYNLVKKYNPSIKKEDIQSHLNKASEVKSMFRKGGKRTYNYGYLGDLNKRVEEDRNIRERREKEAGVNSRLSYIKRDTAAPSGNRGFEKPGLTSRNFTPKSYTPAPPSGTKRVSEREPYVAATGRRHRRNVSGLPTYGRDKSASKFDRSKSPLRRPPSENRHYKPKATEPVARS
jgi:hypothetical protein